MRQRKSKKTGKAAHSRFPRPHGKRLAHAYMRAGHRRMPPSCRQHYCSGSSCRDIIISIAIFQSAALPIASARFLAATCRRIRPALGRGQRRSRTSAYFIGLLKRLQKAADKQGNEFRHYALLITLAASPSTCDAAFISLEDDYLDRKIMTKYFILLLDRTGHDWRRAFLASL